MHRSLFIMLRALPTLIFLALCCFPFSADAARVTKVKGKQVLIENEGTDIQTGDKMFIMIDGKKKGIVVITKVSKGKSLGKLTKGRAEVDAGVEPTGSSGGGSSADASDDSILGKKKRKKKKGGESEGGLFVGVLAGYAMDSQTVKATNASVSMAGSGYSLKAMGDMPVSGRIGVIGRAGIEQLNLTGSFGGTTYNTSVMYLSADLLMRFSFSESGFIPYFAAGLGLHYPLSKDSNILDKERISMTTIGFLDLGFNYMTSPDFFITGIAELGMFPPSNDVSTQLIALRGGVGWKW